MIASPIYTTTVGADGKFSINMQPFVDGSGTTRVFNGATASERVRIWVDGYDKDDYRVLYNYGQILSPDSRTAVTDTTAGVGWSAGGRRLSNVKISLVERSNAQTMLGDETGWTHRDPVNNSDEYRGDNWGQAAGKIYWNFRAGLGGLRWGDVGQFHNKGDIAAPAGVKVVGAYLSDQAVAEIYKYVGENRQSLFEGHQFRKIGEWTEKNERDLQAWIKEQIAAHPEWIAEKVSTVTDGNGEYKLQFNGTYGVKGYGPEVSIAGDVPDNLKGTVAATPTEGKYTTVLASGNDRNGNPYVGSTVTKDIKHINWDFFWVGLAEDPGDLAMNESFRGNYWLGFNRQNRARDSFTMTSEFDPIYFAPALLRMGGPRLEGLNYSFFPGDLRFNVLKYDTSDNFAGPGDTVQNETTGLQYAPGYGKPTYKIVWRDENGKEVTSCDGVQPDGTGKLPSCPMTVPADLAKTTSYTASLYVHVDGDDVLLAADSFTAQAGDAKDFDGNYADTMVEPGQTVTSPKPTFDKTATAEVETDEAPAGTTYAIDDETIPVFNKPVLDENGEQKMEPLLDDKNNPITYEDENGNKVPVMVPVTEPVQWDVKVDEQTGEVTVTVPEGAPTGRSLRVPVVVTYPDGVKDVAYATFVVGHPPVEEGAIKYDDGISIPKEANPRTDDSGNAQPAEGLKEDGDVYAFAEKLPEGCEVDADDPNKIVKAPSAEGAEDGMTATIDPQTGKVTVDADGYAEIKAEENFMLPVVLLNGDTPKATGYVPVFVEEKIVENGVIYLDDITIAKDADPREGKASVKELAEGVRKEEGDTFAFAKVLPDGWEVDADDPNKIVKSSSIDGAADGISATIDPATGEVTVVADKYAEVKPAELLKLPVILTDGEHIKATGYIGLVVDYEAVENGVTYDDGINIPAGDEDRKDESSAAGLAAGVEEDAGDRFAFGNSLPDGWTKDAEDPNKIVKVPSAAGANDGVTATIDPDTGVVTVEAEPNAEITADANVKLPVALVNGETTKATGEVPVEVAKKAAADKIVGTLTEPVFGGANAEDPATCDIEPFVTVTETEGVDYVVTVGDHEIQPNAEGKYVYGYGETVQVVAKAQEGFQFAEGAKTEWTWTAPTQEQCQAPGEVPNWENDEAKPGEAVTLPNTGGQVSAEDVNLTVSGPGEAHIDEDGNLVVTPNADAKPGETITVTVTDKDGKELDKVEITVGQPDAEAPSWDDNSGKPGQQVEIPNNGGPVENGTDVTVEGPGKATIDENGNITVEIDENAEPGSTVTVIVTDAAGNEIDRIVIEVQKPDTAEKPNWGTGTVKPGEDIKLPNTGGQVEDGTTVDVEGPGEAHIDEAGNLIVTPNADAKPGDKITVIVKDKDGNEIDRVVITVGEETTPGGSSNLPDGLIPGLIGGGIIGGIIGSNLPGSSDLGSSGKPGAPGAGDQGGNAGDQGGQGAGEQGGNDGDQSGTSGDQGAAQGGDAAQGGAQSGAAGQSGAGAGQIGAADSADRGGQLAMTGVSGVAIMLGAAAMALAIGGALLGLRRRREN